MSSRNSFYWGWKGPETLDCQIYWGNRCIIMNREDTTESWFLEFHEMFVHDVMVIIIIIIIIMYIKS